LLRKRQNGTKKYEDPKYKEALFKILHTPPSSYDINRTTWKMDDLQRMMILEGFGLGKAHIRKIIKDAGYTVALHLTVVKLTCNENGDPDRLLLARCHTQPTGAYHGSHDGMLPQWALPCQRPNRHGQ
jgi:hypothetical protein